MNLQGATVVLTGGSRGIGAAAARELAASGARLALAARSADELEAVRADLAATGATVIAIPTDVTEPDDRDALVQLVEAQLGPPDVLVNNAGIEVIGPFREQTEDSIRSIFEVNILAAMSLTRLVLPGMLDRGRGHIVNMASVAGKTITPYNSVYSATKHAMVGWTHALRFELEGTGVSASVICPAFVAGDGLFARWGDERMAKKAGLLTTIGEVARAVPRAIEKDQAEVVLSGALGKLADVALAISPGMTARLARRSPAVRMFREHAAAGEDD